MAAILPLAETVLLGAVDGALRGADVKAGRSTTFKQWSTYLELGLVGLGAVAATQRVHPDWWEPMVITGLAFLSQRGGAWAGHQAGIGGPDGWGGWGDFGGVGGAAARRSVRPAVGAPFQLPAGNVLGHERMQPVGIFG